MKRKIICLILCCIMLLTIPTATTSLSQSPPDLLDQSCMSGDSYQNKNPPVGSLGQKITTSVMFITKFEVKLSRLGTEDDCLIAIGLYCDGEIQRIKTIIFNDLSESAKWYTCTFNDLDNEDENKQPYVVEDTSDLAIKVFFIGGSLGSDAEIRWHGDPNDPYEDGEAYNYEGFDFNFKTYGYNPLFIEVLRNGGSISIDGVEYENGDTCYLLGGTYEIKANIDEGHEFVKWRYPPGAVSLITYEDVYSAYTTVTVGGLGFVIMECLNIPPNKPETPSGPTEAYTGESVEFSTSTIDINDNVVFFQWMIGDEYTMWSGPIPSGGTDTQYESFDEPGTYEIKAYAKDIEGATSEWSDSHYITIEEAPNDPPLTPSTPDGPSSGITGVEYSFSTSSTDPNSDKIKYGWDWDNDGNVDEWSNFKLSGITHTKKMSWNTPGTYNIKVIAEDKKGDASSWSQTTSITISENNPPLKPSAPEGPASGQKGTSYQYSASSTDSDGDKLEYKFNWGDGDQSVWKGPYNSGETASASHKWTEEGGFDVKVKVRDEHGVESEWSDPLSVVMPKSARKTSFITILRDIINIFPLLEKLLHL